MSGSSGRRDIEHLAGLPLPAWALRDIRCYTSAFMNYIMCLMLWAAVIMLVSGLVLHICVGLSRDLMYDGIIGSVPVGALALVWRRTRRILLAIEQALSELPRK